MVPSEFDGWIDYFDRHPFDDLHRYHRPALADTLIRGGLPFDKVLDWMKDGEPMAPREMTPEEADAQTLRTFGLSRPRK